MYMIYVHIYSLEFREESISIKIPKRLFSSEGSVRIFANCEHIAKSHLGLPIVNS